MITTINPATEEILNEYQEFDESQIEAKIELASKQQKLWQKTTFAHRSTLMKQAACILRDGKQKYAKLMALEMGKPLSQGIAEAEKCALVCDYYAENAENQLADEIIKTEFSKSYASYQPIGTVLAIMPWNFPFWQVFRFAAPGLMAGNAGLLKHSSNTMGCAIAIEEIFKEAGFPEGIFSSLVVGSALIARIIEHHKIAAVTLTGSTPVGQKVAAKAGSCIKKTVMELGGSDPYVILADADLKKAAAACTTARLINSGQSCIAAKRFVVVESVIDDFTALFVENMKNNKMGNPLEEGIAVGPQARKDLQLDLQRQVETSVKMGAKLLLGGNIPEGKGYYYPPSVLTDVRKGMPAYYEELFGPPAAIIPVKNEEEAIAVANDTSFGLGAAIFTEDIEKGERIAREELQAGACFLNAFVRSDPRLPFGGIKESGYGRELSSFGIKEFVNIKCVCVE